jgi:hypothetical protein
MFDRPILIYSDYCVYSKQFLQLLIKHKKLFDSFIRMNIDIDPRTKQRPVAFYKIQKQINTNITKVPTIIVKNKNNELLLLSDKDAFKWLDFETREIVKVGISGFNKHEMESFSDKYSKYGSTDLNDATEQNFKFFRNNDGNILLTDDDLGCIEESEEDPKNKDKKKVEDNFNREQFNLSSQMGQNNASQMIDFTNPNFGLAGKLNEQVNRSDKAKDVDKRLQQLMNERNNL